MYTLSQHLVADYHRQQLLAEAEQDRRIALLRVGQAGPMARRRLQAGSLLIRAGERLRGGAPGAVTETPVATPDAATAPELRLAR